MPALLKPSGLERKVSKWQKQTVRDKEKQARKRQAERKWRALSALVKQRDGGKCRVCGVTTTTTGDPRLIGATHHCRYKSAGGTDDLKNLIHVCAHCHAEEHAHQIQIIGNADGFTVARV